MYSISCPGRIALLRFAGDTTSLAYHSLGPGGFSNGFSQAGKIHPCLCGRIHGFVGLDGQKVYVMNFRRPIKKLLACLATDVARLATERLPMNFSRPEKSYGLCVWQQAAASGWGCLDTQETSTIAFQKKTTPQ